MITGDVLVVGFKPVLQSSIVYVMSIDFSNGELIAALFDVQYKHTELGPYPSITLSKAEKVSNGWEVPEAESQVSVAGSVKMAVGVTVVW